MSAFSFLAAIFLLIVQPSFARVQVLLNRYVYICKLTMSSICADSLPSSLPIFLISSFSIITPSTAMNAQNILSAKTCFFLLLWSFSYYGPTKADSTTAALETWCTLEGLSCASWNKDTKDCDFTGCQDLAKLSLKNTQLTGPLPVGLQNLVKLQFLYVRMGAVFC